MAVGAACVSIGCAIGETIPSPETRQLDAVDDGTNGAPLHDGGAGAANCPSQPSVQPQGPDVPEGGAGGAPPETGGAPSETGGAGGSSGTGTDAGGTGGSDEPVSNGGAPGVARPEGNTGRGFFVRDGSVYDANGAEFRIRGLNHTHWWGQNNDAAIPHIANTGTNAVRVVFGSGMGASTPEARRAVVESYLAHDIVPIVDQHDGTCQSDPSLLRGIVDFWTNPAEKAWLVDHEEEVILNVANEWGPTDATWRDAYIEAIGRLRAAGINNMLVIDAGECGQSADVLLNYAQDVFASDPQKNVAFGVHMYTYWVDAGSPVAKTWSSTAPYDLKETLAALKSKGLALIVGEFSWQGASSLVWYDTKAAMKEFEADGIGWLAWSWNQNSDPLLDMVHDYTYDAESDLTDFGNLIVNDAEVGLKALAQKATVF